jgi:hypothetical protein
MAIKRETSKARLNTLVPPELDDLTSIAALEEAMNKIRAQDRENDRIFKEKYAQYRKERDVLLPQRIAGPLAWTAVQDSSEPSAGCSVIGREKN